MRGRPKCILTDEWCAFKSADKKTCLGNRILRKRCKATMQMRTAKRTAKKCMHCGHPIKKVYFISSGQSIWEWRHTSGGRYCKVGGEYSGCLCNNAEPATEEGD